MQRLGPPHWPAYPPGAAYGRALRPRSGRGLAAARLGARLIAADLAALGINVDCLPLADVPVSGADRGDRRPRLWRHARQGRGDRRAPSPRAWPRAACCRCSSTSPAMAAPPPTATIELPVVHADRATLEATDFAAFRPLTRLPLGMTAHVVFTAIDPVRTGHDFGHNDRRSDSRLYRLRRAADERRHFDGGAVGIARRARAGLARGRLRPGAALQRQDRRDAGGGRRGAGACRRGASGAPMRRWLCAKSPCRDSILRRRARVCRHDDGNGWPDERRPLHSRPNVAERGSDEPALIVDVEGFEGPLDLLLTLARQQKVDLAKISILALAEQYLAFIEEARKLRLELAADYLVMAAWLAYLKSRLLLPEPASPEGRAPRTWRTRWRCG